MKYIKLIILFGFIFSFASSAQSKLESEFSKKEIRELFLGGNPLNYEFVQKNGVHINRGNGFYESEFKDFTDKLWMAHRLNVWAYMDLEEKYNSELKKSEFMKTDDYMSALNQVKAAKQALNEETYIIGLEFNDYTISNYDLKNGTFDFEIGTSKDYLGYNAFKYDPRNKSRGYEYSDKSFSYYKVRPPRTILDFDISKIPLIQKKTRDAISEFIRLKIPRDIAIQIEENRSDILLVLVSDISSSKKISFDANWSRNSHLTDEIALAQSEVFSGAFLRMMIYNSVTGVLLYDKMYK